MRKISTLIALVLSLNAFGQNEKNFQSHWRADNTNVSKLTDDNFEFFKRGNFLYYISNDKDNLYIDIKIEDSGVQYKILQEGLTVWINADGKLQKKVGIRYPLGVKFTRGPGMRNSGSTGSASPLAMANTIQLIGFQGQEPNMFPAKNQDNFSGSMEYDDQGNLYYTLKMPVSRLPFISAKEGAGFEPCSIGIEYGGMPEMGNRPAGQTPPQRGDGMPSGGGPGRPGSGRSPGRSGGGGGSGSIGSGPSAPPASTVEASKLVWIKKISLADQH